MGEAAKKTGVDDFFAAGGTVAELLLRAHPYEPQDTARERLSRDERLRRAVEDLWRAHHAMPRVKSAECTDRATMRDFIRKAERSGKVVGDGVLVTHSAREGALAAEISLGGWKKSRDRLEDARFIRRVHEPNKPKEKAASYVLLSAKGGRAVSEQYGKKGPAEEKETQERERENSFSKAAYARGVHSTRAPSDEVPELRHPKTVFTWEWKGSRRRMVDYFYVARLGKRRGEIIRYTFEAGGSATVEELHERFGARRGRVRDFRRRILGPLEAERIATIDGETFTLAEKWREALEGVRDRDEELEDARLQAERYKEQQRKFRERDKTQADEEPGLKGKEHNRRTQERNAPQWQRERVEDQRQKVGTTCETFVHDTLARLGKIRFGLLRDMWAERGGKRDHVRFAIKALGYKMEQLPEYGNALFVFPVESSPPEPQKQPEVHEAEPAPVIPLVREPRKVEGVHVHGPECLCDWCDDSPEPQYAKLVGAP